MAVAGDMVWPHSALNIVTWLRKFEKKLFSKTFSICYEKRTAPLPTKFYELFDLRQRYVNPLLKVSNIIYH